MGDELDKARQLLMDTMNLAAADAKLSRVCHKLSRKIKADIAFLEKYKSKSAAKINKKVSQSSLTSSNIPYLSGVLNVVKESQGVTEVICDLKRYGIVVDVVCNDGRTWKKVIARNPQSLHLIWAGKGQYGTKDVVKKAEKYLHCVKLHNEFSPPDVICVFVNGVTHEMAEVLESKGITVEGARVDVSQEVKERLTAVFSESDDSECESDFTSDSESETDSKIINGDSKVLADKNHEEIKADLLYRIQHMPSNKKVFLDITTMLVYVSDLCHGGCHHDFTEPVLAKQAADELELSALNAISPYMCGRTLVTCESALHDYWNIVTMMGGPDEKLRAQDLVDKLTVVPDCVSTRFSNLAASGQIRERSKLIFGAADLLHCDILTSNEGFVRAAAAQNIHISAVFHQPRALSEEKKLVKLLA